jgi:hypothetical protein
MYVNTDQPQNDAVMKLGSLKWRLYLVRYRDELDIDNFVPSDGVTVNMIPLLPGKTMHYLDCRPSSIIASAPSSGNIAPQGTLSVTADIEGISKPTLQWLYQNTGERFLVIWQNCATGQAFIGGSPCSGLMLSYKSVGTQNNGEWQGAQIDFKGDMCQEPICFYDGNIVLESPVVAVLASGVFAIGTGSQYLIPDGVTAATTITDISGVSDSDVGRIIDLKGAGLTYPATIAASAKFILRGGVNYSATNGSSISFEIIKTGTSTYAFYEVARS